MSGEPTSFIQEQILKLVRAFGEIQVSEIIEYVWREDGVSDFPENEVLAILEKLSTERAIEWDKQEEVIRIRSLAIVDDFEELSRPRTIGRWQYLINGRYYLPDYSSIDIELLLEEFQKKENKINIGKMDITSSEDQDRIDLDWEMGGLVCTCFLSADSFYINSLMFSEPNREILNFMHGRARPNPGFVKKAIPFAGAYLVYEHMKSILVKVYSSTIFELTRIREIQNRERV